MDQPDGGTVVARPRPDRAALTAWIVQYLSQVLHIPEGDIGLEQGLVDLGLDSADAIMMSGEMELRFGIEIDPARFLELQTIAEMIDRLSAQETTADG